MFLLMMSITAFAQELPAAFGDGLRFYQDGQFQDALLSFADVIRDDKVAAYDGHAYFWIGRTYMALQEYNSAADAFDFYLASYGVHPYREEASYQRARLFYLAGAYEAALQRFADFVTDYGQSDYVANALYWSGESLYALGQLDSARDLFVEVTERFPTSFRVEAARYRRDVIDLKLREEELLKLLRWSHEEYLSALDDFQQKEAGYRDALRTYRERLANLGTEDFEAELGALNQQIDQLSATLAERDAQINDLLSQLRQAQGQSTLPAEETPASEDEAVRQELMAIREQALQLQQLLLEEDQARESE